MFNGNVSFNESGTSIGSVVGTGACLSAGWYGAKAIGDAVAGAVKGAPVAPVPTTFEAATMEAAKVLPWATIVIAAVTLINALIAWLQWPVELLKQGLLWVIRQLTKLVNFLNPMNWFRKAPAKPVAAAEEATTPEPVVTEEAVATEEAVTPEPVATEEPVTPEPVATEEPVTPEPVATEKAVTPEPVATEKAVTPEPVTPEPVTPEPVAAAPDNKATNYRGKKKHGR